VVDSNNTTLLAIDGIPMSPYASRGLTQSLAPIAASLSQKRTVNGELDNLAPAQFQKLASTINGGDQLPPCFDGIYVGMQVTVDCLCELSYLTSVGSPARTVVPDSSRTEGLFTYYRPRIVMLVTAWSSDGDEYNAKVTWSLSLEEK
jgi:hypothetical protein